MESIKKLLITHGLKATHQRMVIYQALDNCTQHPDAEQLFELLKANNPSLSLATVYKTLESFTKAGLVQKASTPDGRMRYDAHTGPHHHIYCTNTQELLDFEDPELAILLEQYFNKKQIKNLTVSSISVQIKGSKTNPETKITYQ